VDARVTQTSGNRQRKNEDAQTLTATMPIGQGSGTDRAIRGAVGRNHDIADGASLQGAARQGHCTEHPTRGLFGFFGVWRVSWYGLEHRDRKIISRILPTEKEARLMPNRLRIL
jgi:hypothetical protein